MKVLALAVILAARSAHADCDPAEATQLRARLEAESVRMDHWRYGWSIAYGAATAVQVGLVVAKYKPGGTYDHDYRDANLVGAAQSTVGALGALLAPGIDMPTLQADTCADLKALQATRAKAGASERKLFWLGHIGNLVVNLAGSAFLVEDTTWSAAILAFVIGYPIGLLNTYTMPRESWHAIRVVPTPVAGGGLTLGVVGTF